MSIEELEPFLQTVVCAFELGTLQRGGGLDDQDADFVLWYLRYKGICQKVEAQALEQARRRQGG